MPTSQEVPTNVNEPTGNQAEPGHEPAETPSPNLRGSRWVDYDTHELLEMISELEDERRWARLREGILWALILHVLLISSLTWIPKYVFKVPLVIDPIDAIKKRKDLTYLDSLPDAIRELQPKVVIKPVAPKQTTVDKKTLEALNRPVPPPVPQPAPTAAAPAQPAPTPAPLPPSPQPAPQPALDAPRPSAVPARPSFAMNSDNPADQLREAMRNASRNPGSGGAGTPGGGGGGLRRHPGAGTGGVEILSDTQGVDFRAWDPLIPDEVNPPLLKSGMVVIRFRVLPNGRLVEPNGVFLEGRSGDTALDRAAWGALTGSNYPALPRDFHGPYLELRAYFLYNMQPSTK